MARRSRRKTPRKRSSSRRQLRRFDPNARSLIVGFPLVAVTIVLVGLIMQNLSELGIEGFLKGLALSAVSPVGLVLLVLSVGYFIHQSQLSKERLWRRKRLPIFARLRFGRERAAQTCTFCHDSLDADPIVCPGCEVAMHADCHAEAHGCGTIGCEHQGRRVPAKKGWLKAPKSMLRG